MKIESSDKMIQELLKSKFLDIPRFQRPYSWDSDNVEIFWRDIEASINEEYFIGSMVVYQKDTDTLSIVDGQQRLTTITILICVLRDFYAEHGFEDHAAVLHRFVENKDSRNKDKYVLDSEIPFPFFQDNILATNKSEARGNPNGSGEQALIRAHKIFKDKVSELLKGAPEDNGELRQQYIEAKLNSVAKAVRELRLILVQLENEDDAYLIFETLNTRGKSLSVIDLAKNLFSKLWTAPGDVDHVKLKWGEMLASLDLAESTIDPSDFLAHYWASQFELVTKAKLYPAMNKALTVRNAQAMLNEIVDNAAIYRSIRDENYVWTKGELQISHSVEALRIFNVGQQQPMVLALLRAYKKNILRLGNVVKMLHTIENFHFLHNAITSGRSSQTIATNYSKSAISLSRADGPETATAILEDLRRKLRARVPSEDEFVVNFRELQFTSKNTKKSKLVRYILTKFAVYEDLKFLPAGSGFSIEHFQPQSRTEKNGWDESSVGAIGNLILMDSALNGSLGNAGTEEKLAKIKNPEVSIPMFMREKRPWAPALVKERTEDMARVAYREIWKV